MKPSVKCEKTSQHGFSGNKQKGDKHITVAIRNVRYFKKKDSHHLGFTQEQNGKGINVAFELAEFRYVNQ